MYCTKCDAPNSEVMKFCVACGAALGALASPQSRLSPDQLPVILQSNMTPLQRAVLAFGVRNMTVRSAVVQTFNLGSYSTGTVRFGGVGRSLGAWAVFGGLGSIQQESFNSFRTDVQLKLEDDAGYRVFLSTNLPFAVTLSIQPGDVVRIYFAKGGFFKPPDPSDFCIYQWAPFAAENIETGQVVPIRGLPTLTAPGLNNSLVAGIVLGVMGLLLLLPGVALGDAGLPLLIIGSLVCAVAAALLFRQFLKKRTYQRQISEACRAADMATV